jgi:hypothetical protein
MAITALYNTTCCIATSFTPSLNPYLYGQKSALPPDLNALAREIILWKYVSHLNIIIVCIIPHGAG